MKNLSKLYDKDYFENGPESGKSLYTNYHWLPEQTMGMAASIISYLKLCPVKDEILDYGCAKGFLVKALRLLGYQAYGVDVSGYAIKNCDPFVKDYCSLIKGTLVGDRKFSWILAKDVFEHISEEDIDEVLSAIAKRTSFLFCVIPLGYEMQRGDHNSTSNSQFVIPEYGQDITHVLIKDDKWWFDKLSQFFGNVVYTYRVKGVKDKWYDVNPYGNGFFICKV